MLETLKSFLNSDKERVGFILTTGEVVEVENKCSDKENGFEVSGADLLKYISHVKSSWHTHPNATSQMSENDDFGFRNYPEWTHFIVGSDGVTEYHVVNGVCRVKEHYAG